LGKTWPALDVEAAFRRPDDTGIDHGELLQAALTDFNVIAVDEASPERWRVYFDTASERDRASGVLSRDFPALRFSPVDVADEDWAARSQASLGRIEIGRIIVAPPWDVPLVITIKPSMGFGTGHHATTRLCLAALQRVEVSGRSVLDVGTGSAVLAVAASLLGAADVTGIDDDDDAIHAAWENLALNPGASVTLIVGDLRATELNAADTVLANLTGGLLIAAADRLLQLVAPGGRLVISGFQTHEEESVAAAFAALTVAWRGDEDVWVCLQFS
jgi:ribosomal protein L11 methyltransferase